MDINATGQAVKCINSRWVTFGTFGWDWVVEGWGWVVEGWGWVVEGWGVEIRLVGG